VSAVAFAVLALMLTGPVPAMLARAAWPLRAPRAAVVLWQAIAIAGVLSAFSAGLAVASLMTAGVDGLGWPLWLAAAGVFVLTLLIGARLVVAVLRVAVVTRRRRAWHRAIVDLVGECPAGPSLDGLRVLAVDQPLAYCLPGMRSRVVLSAGALAALRPVEVAAILRHERAHLRARHDLVLEAFTAVHSAFPRLVRSAHALGAVRLLVELLADDAAVRGTGRTPLARALVACAAAPTPAGALAAGGPSTVVRVQRLAGRPNSRAYSLLAYLGAAGVLVWPTVAVAVPWLTELHRLFLS
jgi:Zn-dependent protease with chaperone function